MDKARGIAVPPAKKTRGRRLRIVARAGVHLARLHGAVAEFDRDARPDCARIPLGPAKPDAKRMAADHAVVSKRKRSVVVARCNKVGPAVPVEIDDRESLRVARDDQAALGGGHGRESAPSVTAQQLAQAAVETTDERDRRIGILHGVYVSVAVAVKVPGDQPLDRGDLRDPGQRLEPVAAVGLAQEDPAPEFRGRKALRRSDPLLAQNVPKRRPGRNSRSWGSV